MDLKTAIESRSSVREFTSEPVSAADLREMVRLAGCAPSVNNSQPWRYVAVTNAQLRQRMADAVRTKLVEMLPPNPADDVERAANDKLLEFCGWFGQAPAVMVVATRDYEAVLDRVLVRWGLTPDDAARLRGHPTAVSVGASVENLLLAATSLGYASCWLTGPLVAARELEALVNISAPWRAGAVIAVGKAKRLTSQSPKNPVDEIFELIP